ARERLLPEDQAQVLPVGEARAGAVDLYGPARQAAAAAGMGIRDGAGRSDLHLQAPAGMQLAASHGGWDRFDPCLLPHPRPAPIRCSRAARAPSTTPPTRRPRSRSWSRRGGSISAPGATARTAITTGAPRPGWSPASP